MKLALLGCIHGNPWAFEAVLEDLARMGVQERYLLGDLVGDAPGNNDVVAEVRKRNLSALMGHWDAACVTGDASLLREGAPEADPEGLRNALARVRGALEPTHQAFLLGLPKSLRLTVEGVRLHLAHGSPHRLTVGVAPEDAAAHRASLEAARADVFGCAHTHRAFVARAGPGLVVNAGSVGQSADGPEASYALVTLESGKAEAVIRRVAYDVAAWQKARAAAER